MYIHMITYSHRGDTERRKRSMKEYEYHGYIIKQERKAVGFGFTWAAYKDGELIGYADREKVAKETVDWHSQYGGKD